MEIKNQDSIDITLPENSNRSLINVYLKIVFLPIAIFVVFLLGYLKVINFKVELHSIVMMGILLLIALVFARHSAEYGCCLFEDRLDEFKKGLKDHILSHLLILGNKKKSNIAFENFVDEFSQEMRNENYASVGAGVFPMLGILGTFISIAISMPEFSSTNIDMLEKEISQLLGGVGTAFYVSIYGIFLALWWIYFDKKGISKYQKLLLKYKNATKNFFWSKDEISQSYMQEILNKNEKISDSFDDIFNKEFSSDMNSALKQKFDNFKEVIKLEQDSLKLTSSELDRANDMIVKTAEFQKQISHKYNLSLEMMNDIILRISQIQKDLSDQYAKFNEINDIKSADLDKLASSLSKELKNFDISLKNASDDMVKNQKMVIDDFNMRLKDELDDFKSVFKEQSVDGCDNSDVIEELKKSLADMDKQTSDIFSKQIKQDEDK